MSKYANPVGLLYEMFVGHPLSPKFVLVEESGPGHSLTFVYQVLSQFYLLGLFFTYILVGYC